MWKPLLQILWQGTKILLSMFLAVAWMRLASLFGATPLEAGFSVVVAAIVFGTFLITGVLEAVGDSLHPKLDELIVKATESTTR
jgi:hypothetical protein